jgi:hypothetical protein
MTYSKPMFTIMSDKAHNEKRDYELDSKSTVDYYCLMCKPHKRIHKGVFHSHLERVPKVIKKQ